MSTETFTEADVTEAVEIVTRAFGDELRDRFGALDAIEIMVAAVRRIEALVDNA